MKSLVCSAALVAAVGGWAGVVSAKTPAPSPLETPAWVVLPDEASCSADLELVGRSGAVSPVALVSDGARISLRFAMEAAPERAFLPIRIDQKAFANLVLRAENPKIAVMALSDETLSAMRKGRTLQIAWLSEESVRASLSGAAQALSDLRTCGAQVSAQHRARLAAEGEAQAHAAQEARAKAVADEQLAAARAQTAAAEAERQRQRAEADRASAEAERAQAEADRQRAMALADQQRAAVQRAYADDDGYQASPRGQWVPPRPAYPPYDPRYDW